MEVKIESSWREKLAAEFEEPYFAELAAFVKDEYKSGAVFPPPRDIFRAFDLCPFEKVKVVILGQDPYHGARQANGLAFAVDDGTKLPPSLQNIFKEIENDLGDRALSEEVPRSADRGARSLSQRNGDLVRWARQGVLLLNATLTVRAGSAGSHQERGWERFTDAAVCALSEGREHLVFMLWGNYAKAKGKSESVHIDQSKHLVLEAAHPSPFSAASGFFGCKHFSKANEYLIGNNETPINWL